MEIFYQDSWGTVCDDNWDLDDGDVICRQLGYPAATHTLSKAYFGQGSGLILLDEVDCTGSESSIDQCLHNGWSQTDCDHSEDAGVMCGNLTSVASNFFSKLLTIFQGYNIYRICLIHRGTQRYTHWNPPHDLGQFGGQMMSALEIRNHGFEMRLSGL